MHRCACSVCAYVYSCVYVCVYVYACVSVCACVCVCTVSAGRLSPEWEYRTQASHPCCPPSLSRGVIAFPHPLNGCFSLHCSLLWALIEAIHTGQMFIDHTVWTPFTGQITSLGASEDVSFTGDINTVYYYLSHLGLLSILLNIQSVI